MALRWALIVLAGTVLLGGSIAPAQERSHGERNHMEDADKKLTESLAAFEKEKEPERMLEALEAIESEAATVSTVDRGQPRHKVVELWTKFFATLDKHIDPAWDPKDVPEKNLVPPPSAGVQFPSGVDPAALTDPAARAEYEKRLEANRTKAANYRIQLRLQRLDERSTNGARQFISTHFAATEAERRELEAVVAQSPIGEQRRQMLRSAAPRH
jgi:hypothetical protein